MSPDEIVKFIRVFISPKPRSRPVAAEPPDGLVVLLGAGASMQYGLPGYHDLLKDIHGEIYGKAGASQMGLGDLRKRLDGHFRLAPSGRLREFIRDRLPRVDGAQCLGYRYLARLVRMGIVGAVVNMNFDELLSDALRAEGDITAHMFQSFREAVLSYPCHEDHDGKACVHLVTPNGSLLADGGLPILDIESSDHFTEDEEAAARELLAKNHILVLGYSGPDAKIRGALGEDRQYRMVLVNPEDPSNNFWQSLGRRGSRDLCLSGPDAGFENFMERLYSELTDRKLGASSTPKRIHYYFTAAERAALDNCRLQALRIRALLEVAEEGAIGLEQHADEIFEKVLALSRDRQLPLTSAEKFLLRAASYFHDLGFLWARSEERRSQYPGYILLAEHGRLSERLLERHLSPENVENMVPDLYADDSRQMIFDRVCRLCRLHSRLDVSEFWEEILQADCEVEIDGCKISIRFGLTYGLFTLAEETLAAEPDEILPAATEPQAMRVVEDPVMDLYLRAVAPGTQPRGASIEAWIKYRKDSAEENLKRLRHHYGDPQADVPDEGTLFQRDVELTHLAGAMVEAMEEVSRNAIEKSFPRRADSILDLMLIYTNPVGGAAPGPRVPLTDDRVLRLTERVKEFVERGERKNTHFYYFVDTAGKDEHLQRHFRDSFEKIFYPAWRFLAHYATARFNQVGFLLTVLRCGSSRFRPEVKLGLKNLFDDKIHSNEDHDWWYGHDGCMQCTGKLLECLAFAHEVFSEDEVFSMIPKVKEYLQGICRFLSSDELGDEDWLGLYGEKGRRTKRVADPSYLTAVIKGLVRVLTVNDSLDGRLLSLGDVDYATSFRRLVEERWHFLCESSNVSIHSGFCENNVNELLGDIGLCYLSMRRFLGAPRAPDFLREELAKIRPSDIGRTGRYLLVPARLTLLDNADTTQIREIMDTMKELREDPVWIRRGYSLGSWGYNPEVTKDLADVLVSFWEYALANKDLFEDAYARLPLESVEV